MNISLDDKQKYYISQQVRSAGYKSTSVIEPETLRFHEFYPHELEELRSEITEGWDQGVSQMSIAEILKSKQ